MNKEELNTFPETGYYDKSYPYETEKTVIVFDGKNVSVIKNKKFIQRSFNKCLYDSDCRIFSFEPNEIDTVSHVFGNPNSLLTSKTSDYSLCIVTDTNDDLIIKKLTSKLINVYVNNITEEKLKVEEIIKTISESLNEKTNKNFEKLIGSIYSVGDKVEIQYPEYQKIDKRLRSYVNGKTGTIKEINEPEDYFDDDDHDLLDRFLVEFDQPTKDGRTEMYFAITEITLKEWTLFAEKIMNVFNGIIQKVYIMVFIK